MPWVKLLRIGIFLLSIMTIKNAVAALGDNEASVAADQKAYKAARHTSKQLEKYTVHELSAGSTTIREYADASGKIFGVAWQGLAQPDLSALLGTHLKDFQEANQRTPRQFGRRGSSRVVGDQLVVERYGHMRAVRGRAYLPASLPDGVTSDEIE